MASKAQLTGMQGVYLVAAELAKRGFIASPTSRSTWGADLLVTNHTCTRAFSVQVKTNAVTFGAWLLNKHAKELKSKDHIYVLVNLRKNDKVEFFIVPSRFIAKNSRISERPSSTWYAIDLYLVERFRDSWKTFGDPMAIAA